MSNLPEFVVLLGNDLKPVGQLTRLDEEGEIGARKLKEMDYDDLIVGNIKAVAAALKEGGFIEDDSTLNHLGGGNSEKQIASIDVLFAEVDGAGEFRQLVLIEDKLVRNPQARREVLAQVIEYGRNITSMSFDELCRHTPESHASWLVQNNEAIEGALSNREVLLVICGDRIDPRMVENLEFLSGHLDPVLGFDIALLSMAIYSDGRQHILVPHVVAALGEAERKLQLKVVVKDERGNEIPFQAMSEPMENTRRSSRRERIELADLLLEIRKKADETAVRIAQGLFAFAEKMGAIVVTKGASASVRFRDPVTKNASTLFVVTQKATFYIGWLSQWKDNHRVGPEVAETYKATMSAILGTNVVAQGTGGTNAVPLKAVGEHQSDVEKAVGVAIRALLQPPSTASM